MYSAYLWTLPFIRTLKTITIITVSREHPLYHGCLSGIQSIPDYYLFVTVR